MGVRRFARRARRVLGAATVATLAMAACTSPARDQIEFSEERALSAPTTVGAAARRRPMSSVPIAMPIAAIRTRPARSAGRQTASVRTAASATIARAAAVVPVGPAMAAITAPTASHPRRGTSGHGHELADPLEGLLPEHAPRSEVIDGGERGLVPRRQDLGRRDRPDAR